MLRFLDSFDHLDTTTLYDKWTGFYNNPTDNGIGTATPTPRTGRGCLSSINGGIFKTIDNQQTFICGGAFWFTGLGNGGGIGYNLVNQSPQTKWVMQGDGRAQIFDVHGTAVGTSSIIVNAGNWYFIEFMATLGTAGSATLRINGQTAATCSGSFGGSNGADVINIIGGGGGNAIYVDDFYVFDTNGSFDNTFAGDCAISTITTTADTATIQWATSSGTAHWSLVNEIPPDGDTSYVQTTMTGTSSTGPSDIYNFQHIANNRIIVGVQANIIARKTDLGNRAITLLASNSSTSTAFNTSGQFLNLTYLDFLNQFSSNPLNGSAWTPADFNGISWGYQIVD